MAPQDIETGGVQLHADEGQPLEILGPCFDAGGNERRRRIAVAFGQIGDDGGTLGDGEVAVAQHRDFLAWIEPFELRGFGVRRARSHRHAVVVQAEFDERPMGP